jgi:hypothetical protein
MPATFDIPAVRRFSDDLNEKARSCDNGEGMSCSNLDGKIKHYNGLCVQLREYVNQWARAIFTGQIAFDEQIENLLKQEIRQLLPRANLVAARGRALEKECSTQGLNDLKDHILDFHYLLENWVSPHLSVSPAPRIVLPEDLNQKIRERLKNM